MLDRTNEIATPQIEFEFPTILEKREVENWMEGFAVANSVLSKTGFHIPSLPSIKKGMSRSKCRLLKNSPSKITPKSRGGPPVFNLQINR